MALAISRLTLPSALASLPSMNILDQIIDFFVRLVRGRIDSVEIRAKSKGMAVEARVKGAAAKQFNHVVDGAVGKAKGAVQKAPPPPEAKR